MVRSREYSTCLSRHSAAQATASVLPCPALPRIEADQAPGACDCVTDSGPALR